MKEDNTIPKSFKMTELGLPPENWEVVRLGEIIEEVKEKNELNAKYPVFTVSNIYGFILSDKFFNKQVYSKQRNTYKIVRKNFFAYNPYRINVGSIGLFKSEIGLVSPAYVVFKVRSTDYFYPKFLYRLLKSSFYMSEIERIAMSRGSVRRSLSFKDLSNFEIPFPPFSEQKKIAAVLSAVQEAKEKAEAVIEAARELKKSLMKYLFTYGPMPTEEAENVSLKETEIGLIPEKWDIAKVEKVIRGTQYGLSLRGNQQGRYPILRMNNLIDGQVDTSHLQYVDLDEDNFKKFQLNKGDILFNRTNSFELVGKTALFDLGDDFVFASYLIRVAPDIIQLVPEYLNYYFNWNTTQIRLKVLASRGVSQSNINATKLRDFLIPLPPLHIQQKIAKILSTVDEKIETEENKKKALEELSKTLLNNLMTAKIRVNHLEIGV